MRDYLSVNPDSPLSAATDAELAKLLAMRKGFRLLRDVEETCRFLFMSDEQIAYVRGGMVAVANDTGGTAYRQSQLGLGDIQMAGKTGTAQVRSFDKVASRSSAGVTWRLKDHNLFVAFAPVDAPRYAVAVIVEHGGKGGATAGAPRAREVMRTVLLKDPDMRARIERPLPPEPTGDAIVEDGVVGAAPEPDVVAPPQPSRPAPSAISGPRPYLSEPGR